MSIEFAFLADHADATPIIAKWYFDEWGHLMQGDSIQRTRDRIEDCMNRDEIPFILIAMNGKDLVGAAQLKFRVHNRGLDVLVMERRLSIGCGLEVTATDVCRHRTQLGIRSLSAITSCSVLYRGLSRVHRGYSGQQAWV